MITAIQMKVMHLIFGVILIRMPAVTTPAIMMRMIQIRAAALILRQMTHRIYRQNWNMMSMMIIFLIQVIRDMSKIRSIQNVKKKLRLARNEIFARHGYIFDSADLNKYFNDKNWYIPSIKPSEWSDSLLNKYEKKNIALIKKYE